MSTMENPVLQFGKYKIPDPCTVPEEELRRVGAGKQYCQRCQKVVHDISGMEPREIDALWKKNGGKMCAAFYATTPPLAKNKPRPMAVRLSPQWLRGAAATAMLASVLLQAPAAYASAWAPTAIERSLGSDDRPSVGQPPGSLLLSSVVLDQFGENIVDDIEITVVLPSGERRTITSKAGFFALNLEGIVDADQFVTIRIAAQKFQDLSGSRTYPALTSRVKASAAQNMQVTIKVAYAYNRMSRGDMIR